MRRGLGRPDELEREVAVEAGGPLHVRRGRSGRHGASHGGSPSVRLRRRARRCRRARQAGTRVDGRTHSPSARVEGPSSAESSRVRLRPAIASAPADRRELRGGVLHPDLDRGGDPAARAEDRNRERAAVELVLPAGDREPAQAGHGQRPAEAVRGGDGEGRVRLQPPADVPVDDLRRREGEQRLAHRRGVRRHHRALGEGRDRTAAGELLDVGDLASRAGRRGGPRRRASARGPGGPAARAPRRSAPRRRPTR